MSKKIGFRSYQNDEEPDKQDELEKQQAERQKAIANFIGQNYSPIGTTSQKCYKTTAELVYELSNIVDVAPMALATIPAGNQKTQRLRRILHHDKRASPLQIGRSLLAYDSDSPLLYGAVHIGMAIHGRTSHSDKQRPFRHPTRV